MNVFLCHYAEWSRILEKQMDFQWCCGSPNYPASLSNVFAWVIYEACLHGIDSDLGLDLFLCSQPLNSWPPEWQLMLHPGGRYELKELLSTCKYSLRILKPILENDCAAQILANDSHHTAATLTQGMITNDPVFIVIADRVPAMNPIFEKKSNLGPKGWLKS